MADVAPGPRAAEARNSYTMAGDGGKDLPSEKKPAGFDPGRLKRQA